MTAREQIALLGAEGELVLDHFRVRMRVHDVKDGGWGRTLVFVKPVDEASSGEAWIDIGRLHLRRVA